MVGKVTSEEHKRLALQAAQCAQNVIYLFTHERPDDSRPNEAIEAARNWVAGELSVAEARKAAFAAHAAARECSSPSAVAAARCAGHAAATAHVWTHAAVAETYMNKAISSNDVS